MHTRESAIAEVQVRRAEVDRCIESAGAARLALDNQLRLLNLPGADKVAQSELVTSFKAKMEEAEQKHANAVDGLNDILRTLNNSALLRVREETSQPAAVEPESPVEVNAEASVSSEGEPSDLLGDSMDDLASAAVEPESPGMPKRARGKK